MEKRYLQAAAMNIRALSHMVRERKWSNIFGAVGGIAEVRGATGQLLYEAGMPFLDDLKYVPDSAFYGSDVEDIILPNDCSKIGNYAFSGCTKLKSVLIQGQISNIGKDAFSYNGIESFPFSQMDETNFQVQRLPTGCFSHCAHLTEVTIPYGVISIGCNCFDYCTGLKNIHIPKSVSIINDYAFVNCNNLNTITYEGNMADWRRVLRHPIWKDSRRTKIECIDGTIMSY